MKIGILLQRKSGPDPTRLIDSERMNQLVKDLKGRAQYDKILFDTPPMLNLADAF